MKKKVFFIAMCVLILFVLTIILVSLFIGDRKYSKKSSSTDRGNVYLSRAEKLTGLKLDYGKIIRCYDTKGGFFGEGKVLLEIQYSKEDYKVIEDQVSIQKYWKKLPMKTELTEHLLGLDFEFPPNGYYFFYDRHSEANSHYDYKEMDKRNSMNFSVLILDNDTQEVIYIEKDT